MMKLPAQSDGCSHKAEITQTKAEAYRERCQQEAWAPQTTVSTDCQQTVNGNEESVNRNHSLTIAASPAVPSSDDPQKSPRIGIVHPHPHHAGPPSDSLLATARRYIKRANVDWCKSFNRKKGQYLDRCSVPFEWNNSWYCAVLCQVATNRFMGQVRNHETGDVCDESRASLTVELLDAPAVA